jgi:muramoyltetrapeptide carboxypeptidase
VAIFIDPPAWPAHGRLWAHLVSDVSVDELHAFAAAHGVPRRGFERDHYDVPAELHAALVAAGAQAVTAREVVRVLAESGLRRRKSDAPARRSPGRELLRPTRLRAGDRVAVVATAGVVPQARLERGLEVLRSWGLQPVSAPGVLGQSADFAYLAGPDDVRAAELAAAWSAPDVAAVFAARGGYGTQRVVDLLDWRRLAESPPRVLVGFSDLTALHQALASRLGLVSVHGHVVTSLGDASVDSAERLRLLLMEPDSVVELLPDPVRTLVPGRGEGVLLGGNLAVLTADVGTPTSRPARGGIVVLEEVNEEPYRVDRQLTQLVRSGWFEGVRGVVAGAFTHCGEPAVVERLLLDRLGPLGVPTVTGADIGHTRTSLPVPLGVRATLDADAGSLRLAAPALG